MKGCPRGKISGAIGRSAGVSRMTGVDREMNGLIVSDQGPLPEGDGGEPGPATPGRGLPPPPPLLRLIQGSVHHPWCRLLRSGRELRPAAGFRSTSLQPASAVAGLYSLIAGPSPLWDARRQGFHDKVAHTDLIKVR
jgi:hypothetical protein